MKAKPTPFNGTRGVIALTRWFEKIESIFEICSCSETDKVKFAACTFTDKALTWWNGRVKSLTLPVANAMGWETMKEILLAEYCPRGEMQKLEHELWNLKMKGSDIAACTSRSIERCGFRVYEIFVGTLLPVSLATFLVLSLIHI